MRIHTILYVADQERSTVFYAHVLNQTPLLNVPGMTEFELTPDCVLGLMPLTGIYKLLGEPLKNAEKGTIGAEIYLVVKEPQVYHDRALEAGARELSPFQPRDWGTSVAYSQDADGHILAFASQ